MTPTPEAVERAAQMHQSCKHVWQSTVCIGCVASELSALLSELEWCKQERDRLREVMANHSCAEVMAALTPARGRVVEEEIERLRGALEVQQESFYVERRLRETAEEEIRTLRLAVAHAAYRTHGATKDCELCRGVDAAVDAARPRP